MFDRCLFFYLYHYHYEKYDLIALLFTEVLSRKQYCSTVCEYEQISDPEGFSNLPFEFLFM